MDVGSSTKLCIETALNFNSVYFWEPLGALCHKADKYRRYRSPPMRQIEITAPSTHPHVVELRLDPVMFDQLRRFERDTDAFRILSHNRGRPNTWSVWIGCASEAVAERMEDGWS